MAPELVKRQPTDLRLDIFAFGVERLRDLHVPASLGARHDGPVAMKHAEHAPVEIQRYRPRIHPKLAAAIHKAIERNPDKRFATMKDFSKAIAAVETEDG